MDLSKKVRRNGTFYKKRKKILESICFKNRPNIQERGDHGSSSTAGKIEN